MHHIKLLQNIVPKSEVKAWITPALHVWAMGIVAVVFLYPMTLVTLPPPPKKKSAA
jgi:hypothetical protein